MSQWLEHYDKHPLHSAIKMLEALLIEVKSEDFEEHLNELSSIERVTQVLTLTKARLDATDPALIPIPRLEAINSQLEAIINEISAFIANKNFAHISNVNTNIDNILIYLNDIYIPAQTSDLEGLREAASSYRRSIGQYVRNIEDEHKATLNNLQKMTDKLDSLSTEVNSQKERVDSIVTKFQEQFSAAEQLRRTESTKVTDDLKAKTDKLFEEKRAEWNQLIEETEENSSTLIEQARDSINRLKEELEADSEGLLNKISESRKKAEDLVGIITDTGMVGGYQRVANEEKSSAITWRIFAALSLAALASFAVLAFIATFGQEVKWSAFGARMFVASTFGIFSAYAALQADKHQRAERINRKIELELASISPYLQDLPIEQQYTIKEELAMRLFGQKDSVEAKFDKRSTGSIIELLKTALDSIAELSKK